MGKQLDTGFRMNRSTTEYMHDEFSPHEKSEVEMRLDEWCQMLRYLGLSFQETGMADERYS